MIAMNAGINMIKPLENIVIEHVTGTSIFNKGNYITNANYYREDGEGYMNSLLQIHGNRQMEYIRKETNMEKIAHL